MPITKLHASFSVTQQGINPFLNIKPYQSWMTLRHYVSFFYLSISNTHTHTHTHNISGNVDETRECTHMPTPILPTAVNVKEQVTSPFSISHIAEMGRLYNTECLFFLFFFVKHSQKQIIQGKGDETSEYNHKTTPKLHGAVSVAEQMINPFSLLHITNMGRLDNTESLFFFFFFFFFLSFFDKNTLTQICIWEGG